MSVAQAREVCQNSWMKEALDKLVDRQMQLNQNEEKDEAKCTQKPCLKLLVLRQGAAAKLRKEIEDIHEKLDVQEIEEVEEEMEFLPIKSMAVVYPSLVDEFQVFTQSKSKG